MTSSARTMRPSSSSKSWRTPRSPAWPIYATPIRTLSAEAFFPSEDFKAIRARAAGDWVRFEQLADFRAVRTFRYSVFGRGGGADRRIDATRLIGLWAFADLTIAEADPHRPDGAAFVSSRGAKLRTNNPRFAAFLVRLAEAYPLGVRLDSEDEADALCEPVIRLFLTHVVELRTAQPPCVRISGDRPEASALARVQAARGETLLATLRHAMIPIDEPRMLAFVPLIDGSRTRAELAQEFGRLFVVGAGRGRMAARRIARRARPARADGRIAVGIPRLAQSVATRSVAGCRAMRRHELGSGGRRAYLRAPPACVQAAMPPSMWRADVRPLSCAACTAIAERSPKAQ